MKHFVIYFLEFLCLLNVILIGSALAQGMASVVADIATYPVIRFNLPLKIQLIVKLLLGVKINKMKSL